jgi:hypothetical protein
MRLTLLLLAVFSAAAIASQRLYNNQFALFIPNGEATADELAVKHSTTISYLSILASTDAVQTTANPTL